MSHYIRAFCFSPAPVPRYLLLALLKRHVKSSINVRRAGLLVVNSRGPKMVATGSAG